MRYDENIKMVNHMKKHIELCSSRKDLENLIDTTCKLFDIARIIVIDRFRLVYNRTPYQYLRDRIKDFEKTIDKSRSTAESRFYERRKRREMPESQKLAWVQLSEMAEKAKKSL